MVKVTQKSTDLGEEKKEATSQAIKKARKESEEELAARSAKKLGLFYLDLNLFPIGPEDVQAIPEETARKLKTVVFQKSGKNVRVGIVNPANKEAREFLEELQKSKNWNIRLYVISPSSFEKAAGKYKETTFMESLEDFRVTLKGEDLEKFEKDFKGLLDLKSRIAEIPTTQVVSTIMAGAVKMKASDIHFEPGEKEVRLRYRLDGVLQDIGYLPRGAYKFITSRVKMMGKMKLNVRDIAQDGHFSVELEGGKVNVRVSIIPGRHGESIVMRLLNQKDVLLKLEELGLRGLAYEKAEKHISNPQGMVLSTGPTGSGKTTTLYAIINKINKPGVKIITIEDPIEYEVKGVSQTQVDKERGYTFEKGLRAIVRQDPEIILVGEIRDEETADIAVNAALTGHLVLSTLHTKTAAGAIPRLIELGIKPNLIAPSVSALIAQRLVRQLCPFCRQSYQPAKETIDMVKKILAVISPKAKLDIPKIIKNLYRPVGCPHCHNLGYRGRIGIFEVLTVSESVKKAIGEMSDVETITQAALEEGMITMTQDGIVKALEGTTSLEEVMRVTEQTEFLVNIYEKLMSQMLARSIEISQEDLELVRENLSSFEKIKKLIKESDQKKTLDFVLVAALFLGAGDVHLEPEESSVKIRLRVDGILHAIGDVPIDEYPSLLGNIKLACGLKTEARQGAKDSRFTIVLNQPYEEIKDTRIDVRVSIMPSGFGETVVMRLLNRGATALDTEKLGIRKQNLEKILGEIKKPNGIFLNTGPTGSGKTTTLYSLLKILNQPEVKIITVEDPVEYQLKGILQTQVNEKEEYTFPTALRSLLRQNPDIMMIGEIRDEETAQIAAQAALTGHLVLSTLHTNDAAGSVSRLINMGLRPDDLATAANGFMAQRLVRKLCECKEKIKPAAEGKEKIEKVLKNISPKAGIKIPKVQFVFRPKGCPKCNGLGYKGRTVISEVLIVDKDIEELISRGELATRIKEKAMENGMLTMAQDGILKVLEGETTLEEVERVTEE
jgi:type II secretory ATPase GspE/PulE/Tfp pilus assembly ATPase PilB-like protein